MTRPKKVEKTNGAAAAGLPPPTQPAAELAAELEAKHQSVREFYAARATDDAVVMVLRHTESGAAEFVAQGSPAAIDEQWIQAHYGGGKYVFRLRTAAGEYLAQSTVSIAAPAGDPAPSSPPGAEYDPMRLQVDLLREQLGRQQEMMLHLIDRPAAAGAPSSGGGNLLQLVQAVGALRELASPQTQITGVIDALSEGLKIGMKQNNPPGGANETKFESVLRIVDRIAEIVPRVMRPAGADAWGSTPTPGGAGASTAAQYPPSSPPPAGDPDAAKRAQLREMVEYIKRRGIGRNPGVWADWIIENLDAPSSAAVGELVAKPYDEITAYIGDPDLNREPFKGWFSELIAELKNGFAENDNATLNPDGAAGYGDRTK